MASLRQAVLASAVGLGLLATALTVLSNGYTNTSLSEMAAEEDAVSGAALVYIRNSAAIQGSTVAYAVNGQQVTLNNGQTSTALTAADLVSKGYLNGQQATLSNGATPFIVVRNENGGLAILVYPTQGNAPESFSGDAHVVLGTSAWNGEIAKNADAQTGATLVAFGGGWQGKGSDFGITAPSSGKFIPVSLQWLSSASMTQEPAAQATPASKIGALQPGQTYTDSQGNTFTAYNSSQGVVIKTIVNVTGSYLWFPQKVFSESSPSISGFYVPSGTGTGDTGEGPYSLSTNGNTVEGYWSGEHQANFPLSDFG